jgi:glutamate racemase
MKIGIFDSGVGGLLIMHSLMQQLPEYDYLYLGDTARVPYGNRSQETVYDFTEQAVEFLFKHDCKIVIIACNTASAEALRKLQREYLPTHYPDRCVLGVLIPAVEEAVKNSVKNKIGVLGTNSTVKSEAFVREVKKLNPKAEVYQQAAPLLVPLIENDGSKWVDPILDEYLAPLLNENVDTIILGCTHYPFLKRVIREKVGNTIKVISQEEIIPSKLRDYFDKHPDIEIALSKTSQRSFLVTDITDVIRNLAAKLFGEEVNLQQVKL